MKVRSTWSAAAAVLALALASASSLSSSVIPESPWRYSAVSMKAGASGGDTARAGRPDRLEAVPTAASASARASALAAKAPAAGEPDLDALRAIYLEAVDDARAIDEGHVEIERIRGSVMVAEGSWLDATLTAYDGALVTLRAKHAFWPTAKLSHLREGLAILDALIEKVPDHAEARYLRLMSCYYLPGILGRNWSVREDFAELARLLPSVRSRYSDPLYTTIVQFVLTEGDLDHHARARLDAALREGG